ncbi:3-deoxy-D-manno-octulosonic acid transferase [Piscinibacter sp.]|uniref:3-deoxy-D-manno-octulosonic acid transferase n=1 Tax=Piscinibacter sp. TaxID=1903157 RepID=UPI001B6DFB5C|nr:3-deoxy-D-manno-octulosonic acid transferase [Piscinibacter sp.]MBK7533228.1 3-deoxy-D-manno-octulosonic acid transferase [Piscinibacter sp.]MBP6542142.1 3-deoxy-D-manno-octulosonic acid transferase [Piscinibacter sp.]HPG78388.1 3-deoxy-D-manno-octulosonic acid transferase [Piscinibacter sp.]
MPWRVRAARSLYSALLVLAQPLYLLRLWWRGRAEPLYREAIGERLGRYRDAPSSGWLWLHAVSLGETRAAAALIEALRARRPGLRLLLTHSTATGRAAGQELLREGDRQTWLPFDTPAAVRRFLVHFEPAIGVLMETEVWPNLLPAAQVRGIPLVLANARLSEKSRRRGERFDAILRPAVEALSLVLAQSEADAQRLRSAGAREVRVCGNLKYDLAPDAALLERGQAWRAALARPVLLFAVSREGEEAPLLGAWARLRSTLAAPPLLVIVPRHPQRFDEVAALMRASGLNIARRSDWGEVPGAAALAADAWLGDSMREMPLYYGLAQVALLGGSFAPLGGQNLIEAAACGCPVVMGPHTFNFAEAAVLAEAAGAALRVEGIEAGLAQALALLGDAQRLADAGERCRSFAAEHRGAAQRMADQVSSCWTEVQTRVPSPA